MNIEFLFRVIESTINYWRSPKWIITPPAHFHLVVHDQIDLPKWTTTWKELSKSSKLDNSVKFDVTIHSAPDNFRDTRLLVNIDDDKNCRKRELMNCKWISDTMWLVSPRELNIVLPSAAITSESKLCDICNSIHEGHICQCCNRSKVCLKSQILPEKKCDACARRCFIVAFDLYAGQRRTWDNREAPEVKIDAITEEGYISLSNGDTEDVNFILVETSPVPWIYCTPTTYLGTTLCTLSHSK